MREDGGSRIEVRGSRDAGCYVGSEAKQSFAVVRSQTEFETEISPSSIFDPRSSIFIPPTSRPVFYFRLQKNSRTMRVKNSSCPHAKSLWEQSCISLLSAPVVKPAGSSNHLCVGSGSVVLIPVAARFSRSRKRSKPRTPQRTKALDRMCRLRFRGQAVNRMNTRWGM